LTCRLIKRNIKVRSCNHFWHGRIISIKYSECVFVALVIQHAIRMRHIFIFGLSGSTTFFPHYLTNCTILEKKLLNIKCVFWFSLQTLFEKFLIPRRGERDVIINVCCYSCKRSVTLVRFERIINFLDRFSENTPISNFVKICLVGADLFHADGRTDRQMDRHDEAKSRF